MGDLAEVLRNLKPVDPAVLHESEIPWRELQPWLEERGYALRPRYHPDWSPSWLKTGKNWSEVEDSIVHFFRNRLDATRISDRKFVMMKRVPADSHEVTIAQYFSAPGVRDDERNRCVPLLEVLHVPNSADVLLITPLLRDWDEPRPQTVGEATEFFRQLLEGLAYMHEHHIAHRDITILNVMMDAEPLFPKPWHPIELYDKRDYVGSGRLPHRNRTAYPVRYWYIDFGLSRQYDPDGPPPIETEFRSGDKTIPEYFLQGVPYNPFPVDVYCAGNVMLEQLDGYHGLEFIRVLVTEMTAQDPSKRPTAQDAFSVFESALAGLTSRQLRQRLVSRSELGPVTFFKGISHFFRTLDYMLRRKPALPTPL